MAVQMESHNILAVVPRQLLNGLEHKSRLLLKGKHSIALQRPWQEVMRPHMTNSIPYRHRWVTVGAIFDVFDTKMLTSREDLRLSVVQQRTV